MFEFEFDFPCIFCEEIEVFTIENKGNLLFGLFHAGSLDCFSELQQLQKHSDFILFFIVFSKFENFHK